MGMRKKMIKQLDSIVKNVKNMKKSIQQMLVRSHPDAAATLEEDFVDSDAKIEKIEHTVKGVGERVKLVEEEVTQFEGVVHGVVLDIGYHADDIVDVQDRVDSLSQAVPFSNFSV